jgi:gas vesicle protein
MGNSKILLGFVAGAAVGALAGILFAPEKGAKTREKIAGKAGDLTDSIKNSFGDFIDGLKQSYVHTKEEVDDLSDKAQASINKVKAEVKSTMG